VDRPTRRRRGAGGAAAVAGVTVAGGCAAVENVPAVRRRLHAEGVVADPDREVPAVEGLPKLAYGGRWRPSTGGTTTGIPARTAPTRSRR